MNVPDCPSCGKPMRFHDRNSLTVYFICDPCSTPDRYMLELVSRVDDEAFYRQLGCWCEQRVA